MMNADKIIETIRMIDSQHLDIRTVTMGISLRDCAGPDTAKAAARVYEKITRKAEHLVRVVENIEREYGIPIVNKRISVTPMALLAEPCAGGDCVAFAKTLDKAAKACGVDFIGGIPPWCKKGTPRGIKNSSLRCPKPFRKPTSSAVR